MAVYNEDLKKQSQAQLSQAGDLQYSQRNVPSLGQAVSNGVRNLGEFVVGKKGISDASSGIESGINKTNALGAGMVNKAQNVVGKIADNYKSSQYGALGGIGNVVKGMLPEKSTNRLNDKIGSTVNDSENLAQSQFKAGLNSNGIQRLKNQPASMSLSSGENPRQSEGNTEFNNLVRPDNIGMSQGKGGSIRYALDKNGKVMREDIGTGNVSQLQNNLTHNVSGGNFNPASGLGDAGIGFSAIKQAIDDGRISATEGLGMYRRANATPEQQQAYQDEAQNSALMQMAFNQPDGQTNIGDISGMRRNAATATALLGKRMDSNDDRMRYGMANQSAMAKIAQDQMQANQAQRNNDRQYELEKSKSTAKKYQPVFSKTIDPMTGEESKSYQGAFDESTGEYTQPNKSFTQAPPEALAELKANPQWIDHFVSTFGYRPEGF